MSFNFLLSVLRFFSHQNLWIESKKLLFINQNLIKYQSLMLRYHPPFFHIHNSEAAPRRKPSRRLHSSNAWASQTSPTTVRF
ncbi:uncharacterized protein DS421_8g226780 [Arachis hypogaea]|nr:uncharacterized protein DS421_8g226780 [Arachis hypogaea]